LPFAGWEAHAENNEPSIVSMHGAQLESWQL
jgi:hypothetical protein